SFLAARCCLVFLKTFAFARRFLARLYCFLALSSLALWAWQPGATRSALASDALATVVDAEDAAWLGARKPKERLSATSAASTMRARVLAMTRPTTRAAGRYGSTTKP